MTKLITPEQVSDQLGITVSTLQFWRTTGRYNLPYVKAGHLVRYRQSDIAAFIERRLYSHTSHPVTE